MFFYETSASYFQGCQSGKRSLMAATELCSAVSNAHYLYSTTNNGFVLISTMNCQGFTAVTDIAGGFSSWRENGLPIIQ